MALGDKANVFEKSAASPCDETAQKASNSPTRKKSSRHLKRGASSPAGDQSRQGEAARTGGPGEQSRAVAAANSGGSEGVISPASSTGPEEKQRKKRRHHHHHHHKKHHHHHAKESNEQKNVKPADGGLEDGTDAEKASPVSPPKARSGVCQVPDEPVTATDKPPIDVKQSQQGTQRDVRTPDVSAQGAQKPDTAETGGMKTGPGSGISEPTKETTPRNALSSQNDPRPCSSMADQGHRSVYYLVGCMIPAIVVCAVGIAVYVVPSCARPPHLYACRICPEPVDG
ncbi:hypothetical protein MTO96_048803 [Rhipicephalus appendiculatus]